MIRRVLRGLIVQTRHTTCPALNKIETAHSCAALCTSASGKTITGDFPPLSINDEKTLGDVQ